MKTRTHQKADQSHNIKHHVGENIFPWNITAVLENMI